LINFVPLAGRTLIEAETELAAPLLCPELLLHLVTERCALWRADEAELAAKDILEPYWAFAWPGGQALARYVLDHPGLFAEKSILDFGTGSGIVAIAAVKAGALRVIAADIDPTALIATGLNAEVNEVALETTARDLIGVDEGWDVVLAADMCYERALSERVVAWMQALASRGALVLAADPARGFIKSESLEEIAVYDAPADVDTDGRIRRRTSILRALGKPAC
jgi:predicted nicotinamide N-methyase